MATKTVELLTSQPILNKEVNVYGDYENPLFLAKDVAEWIEHSNVAMMLQSIDDDEKLVSTMFISGQNRDVWMLTESGLYEVLMMSRKPIAKQFKKGVKEILRTIRKTGVYAATMQKYHIPQTLSRALEFAAEQAKTIERQNTQLMLQAPSVCFAKAVEDSEEYSLIAELAKILCQEGVNIGEKRLYEWLRQNNYLCSKGGYRNQPSQRAMKMKLFRIVKDVITKPNGETKTVTTTKLTSKGIAYFTKKFLTDKNALTLTPAICE